METKKIDEEQQSTTQSKFKMPHVYVILMSMLIISYIATLVIPKGAFEREESPEGFSLILPETFQYIEAPHLTFFDFIFSIPTGMVQAGELIFGGIMIGGLFAVIERTGLLSIVIQFIFRVFQSRKIWVIPTLMIPMAAFTTFTGAMELSLIYLPVLIPLIIKLGYDRFTAFALVLVSTTAGFSVSLTAPATVGLAQTISELPLYSGLNFRIAMLIITLVVGIWYVWRYAKRIERDPMSSYVYGDGIDSEFTYIEEKAVNITKRQIIGIAFLLFGLSVMIYGLLAWGWYFIEIGGWYAFMGITLGIICGLTPSEIAETFNDGFKRFIVAIIVIGLARAISVVLEDGQILDTIIHALSSLVSDLPHQLAAVMMMVVQALFNFLVGSGSGQALITMPIMSGLSDIIGITRQTSVLAFQFGDGFSNIIYPVGLIMAFLALARISYIKWLRFILPLVLLWYGIGAIALIIAQTIGWGASL